ncbi:MAG: hypothetical protein ACI9IA_001746 [Enterobacterales bacterium]|jgi:hypothetical protein
MNAEKAEKLTIVFQDKPVQLDKIIHLVNVEVDT